jgi:hypothetical protein
MNRADGRTKSFDRYEYSYPYPSHGIDALTPMIDRQDQYEYGPIKKVFGDLGRCQKAGRAFNRATNEVRGYT